MYVWKSLPDWDQVSSSCVSYFLLCKFLHLETVFPKVRVVLKIALVGCFRKLSMLGMFNFAVLSSPIKVIFNFLPTCFKGEGNFTVTA